MNSITPAPAKSRFLLINPANWRELLGHVTHSRRQLLGLIVLGTLQSLLLLPVLHLVHLLFDKAIPQKDPGLLIGIGLAVLALRALASGIFLVHRQQSLKVAKAAVRELRHSKLAWLYRQPRDFFGRRDAAQIQSRIVQETERIDNLTSSLLSQILPAAFTTVLLLLALLYINWQLVLLAALLTAVAWGFTQVTGRRVKSETHAFQEHFEYFVQGVAFVIRQMDLTRLRGYEREELARQRLQLQELEQSGVRMAMSFALHGQTQTLLISTVGLTLLVAGGLAVIAGSMTLGNLLAFYLGAGFLSGSVSQLNKAVPEILAGDTALERLYQIRDSDAEPPYTGTRELHFSHELSLQEVSFSYSGKPLLDRISFTLHPGSDVAIIGSNGSGKSTIVDLILGFLRPEGGQLTVDGIAYEEMDCRLFRRRIGVVPQRPTFFKGTIAENVAYGWPGLSRGDIESAARLAHADDFIRKLPLGYDTVIGEGGALLSGGEAQRLAIARALVSQPQLLILDEPTNHLDVESVANIMRDLRQRPGALATLTISHDPAVISLAATVLQLKDGKLLPQNPV